MAFHTTSGIFATPANECSRDYDCPRFDPRRPGKCIKQSRGILCGLLNKNRRCSYNVCAECLVNRDCAVLGERTCSNNRCITIQTPTVDTTTKGECSRDFDCPSIDVGVTGKCVEDVWFGSNECAECIIDRNCDRKVYPFR